MNFSRPCLAIFFIAFFTLCVINLGFAAAADTNSSTTLQTQIPFVENQGQYPSDVQYYSPDMHSGAWVSNDSIGYRVDKTDSNKSLVLQESFIDNHGNIIHLNIQPGEKSPTQVSYFIGNDSSKWKSGVPSYNNLFINQIYPGINLSLQNKGGLVEKIFQISPYTNPYQIIINLQGAVTLSVNSEGQLEIKNSPFDLTQSLPLAYQIINGQKTSVNVSYWLNGFNYGFTLGTYNPQYTLFIDPVINSTYIGGSGIERTYAMDIDSAGNVYLTGQTFSANFPTTPGAYDTSYGGSDEVMVSKLDPTLTILLASTFLGTSGAELGTDIAVDGNGNVFVTGYTNANNFPTTSGAYDTSFNGQWDAFVAKFNNNLTSLLSSTYLGASSGDFGNAITLDSVGTVYVGGWTYSSGFPTTPGAFYTTFGGDADGFISKFNNNLSSLLNSTFLGGNSYDLVTALKIMPGDKLLIGGVTQSTNFPVTPGAYQSTHAPQSNWPNGYRDCYISVMTLNLTSLNASTYLGGSSEDWLLSVDYDTTGNIFASGYTYSSDFPTTPGAYDQTLNGEYDIFVSKLNQNLTSLLASTFLGGNGAEVAYLDLDDRGKVVLGGSTSSINFPLTADAYLTTRSGPNDAILVRMSMDLSTLLFSTLWGGNDVDYGSDVKTDSNGSIILLGVTSSTNFPTNPGAYDTTANGNLDGFVTKFTSLVSLHVNKYASTYNPAYLSNVTFYVAVTNNGPDNATGVQVQDLIPAGFSVTSYLVSQGTYNFTSGIWNIGQINYGNTALMQVLAQVMVHNTTLTNTALLYDVDEWGTDPLENSTSINFFIPPEADLAVTKTVNNSTPNYLDTVSFTVNVTNNGPDSANNVKVSDLLPNALSYISTVLISQGDYNASSGLWNVGTLANGASAALQISALVNGSNRTINNIANVSSDSSDRNLTNNVATADVNVPPTADVMVSKEFRGYYPWSVINTANYGQTVLMRLHVTNNGPNYATGLQISELMPTGLTYGVYTPDGAYYWTNYGYGWIGEDGTWNITTGVWTIPYDLAPSQEFMLDIWGTVSSSNLTIINTANKTAQNEYDWNSSNDNATASLDIPPAADIILTKSFESYYAPSPAETGNYLEFVNVYLYVNNNGPDNATGVKVTDILPNGLDFVSVLYATQGTYDPINGIWDVGIINNGAAWIMITCLVNASNTTFYNTANASADQYDWNITNNNATDSLNVPAAADIVVTKIVSNSSPNYLTNVIYTITAQNNGPNNATGVVITDLLPGTMNFVSATASSGSYISGTGLWSIGNLFNGATATLQIVAQVMAANSTLNNTALLTNVDQYDWNNTNNNSSALINVSPAADIAVTKTVSNSSPLVCENFSWTVTVRNNGPNTATEVVVTDILPAGLNLVSVTPSQGTYNTTTGVWNIGNLVNGATATLVIVTNATESLNGLTITNNATKTAEAQYDWNSTNNAGSATITVPANKNFTLMVKNNGSARIRGLYYVTVYKPCNAAPIYKTYNFYLNPGQSVTFNIGTYPVGTAVSTDEFVYNTATTKKTVSLTNTWTATGLAPYVQNYIVANVPANQAKAALARKRFWINRNLLDVLVVRPPALL